MDIPQRIYNGDRAKEVLENEAFIAVFADMEKDLIESWKNIPATKNHADAREQIHLALTLLGKLKATLQTTLDTGKLAKLEMEHERSLAKRLTDSVSEYFSG